MRRIGAEEDIMPTIPNRAAPTGPYVAHAERLRIEDEDLASRETPRQRAVRETDEEMLRREHIALEYQEEP